MSFGKCIHPCDLHLSQEHSQHFQKVYLLPFPLNPPSEDGSIGTQCDSGGLIAGSIQRE